MQMFVVTPSQLPLLWASDGLGYSNTELGSKYYSLLLGYCLPPFLLEIPVLGKGCLLSQWAVQIQEPSKSVSGWVSTSWGFFQGIQAKGPYTSG